MKDLESEGWSERLSPLVTQSMALIWQCGREVELEDENPLSSLPPKALCTLALIEPTVIKSDHTHVERTGR